jgi:hypothetical protein
MARDTGVRTDIKRALDERQLLPVFAGLQKTLAAESDESADYAYTDYGSGSVHKRLLVSFKKFSWKILPVRFNRLFELICVRPGMRVMTG